MLFFVTPRVTRDSQERAGDRDERAWRFRSRGDVPDTDSLRSLNCSTFFTQIRQSRNLVICVLAVLMPLPALRAGGDMLSGSPSVRPSREFMNTFL